MCDAYFIDDAWNLHKKIILFVPVTSHKREYIAKALEHSLLEWGIKNVFTLTVDNTSSNDTTVGYFKKKLLSWGSSSVRIKFLHMRCISHILNLIVTDGLKDVNSSIKKKLGRQLNTFATLLLGWGSLGKSQTLLALSVNLYCLLMVQLDGIPHTLC